MKKVMLPEGIELWFRMEAAIRLTDVECRKKFVKESVDVIEGMLGQILK